MGFEFFEEKSVKNAIVKILSEEWPLTAKKIFYSIKKILKRGVSYQAVFKALNEMVKKDFLKKEGYHYSLNREWIDQMFNLFDDLRKNFFSNPENFASLILKKKAFSLNAHTYHHFLAILIKVLDKLYFLTESDGRVCFLECKHLYPPFGLGENEVKELQAGFKKYKKIYILCKGNTKMDRAIYSMYKKINPNVQVLFGQDVAADSDLFIGGDTFAQVFYSEEILDSLEGLSKKFDFEKVITQYPSFFKKKGRITGLISRNRDFTRIKKESILKKFKS